MSCILFENVAHAELVGSLEESTREQSSMIKMKDAAIHQVFDRLIAHKTEPIVMDRTTGLMRLIRIGDAPYYSQLLFHRKGIGNWREHSITYPARYSGKYRETIDAGCH
jgi:hypothetical protein